MKFVTGPLCRPAAEQRAAEAAEPAPNPSAAQLTSKPSEEESTDGAEAAEENHTDSTNTNNITSVRYLLQSAAENHRNARLTIADETVSFQAEMEARAKKQTSSLTPSAQLAEVARAVYQAGHLTCPPDHPA